MFSKKLKKQKTEKIILHFGYAKKNKKWWRFFQKENLLKMHKKISYLKFKNPSELFFSVS